MPAEREEGDGRKSDVVIRNTTIIHTDSEDCRLQPNASILIRDGKIHSIAEDHAVQPGTQVIDGEGKFVLPGYIDTHVHFFQSGNPYTRPDTIDLEKLVPYAEENKRNHLRLEATLRTWLGCGVTGVMDMGGPMWNFAVRETAERMPDAPTVLTTGPLFSMVPDPKLELDDPPIIQVSTIGEVRELASSVLSRKPNYLKVWFIHRPGDDLAGQEGLVMEVAGLAHRSGIPLAVHATELETAKAALRSGADILVHSVADKEVDDEFISLAMQRGAVYEPTLYVPRGYWEVFSRNWKPTGNERALADPEIMDRMQDLEKVGESDIPERLLPVFRSMGSGPQPEAEHRWKIAERNLVKVWKSGITVTLATDAGNIGTVHGPSIFREMELMVHAGLTPAQVLKCATVNGAFAMGIENEVGKVAEGFNADLLLLNSNPAESISNASDIKLVIKGGNVFRRESLLASR